MHLADPGISPPNLAAVQEISAGIYRVAGAVSAPEEVAALASRVIEQRDDLASVEWTLQAADGHAAISLTRALEAVDEDAQAILSAFAFAPDLGDEDRILSVHWQEPERWWGALARA